TFLVAGGVSADEHPLGTLEIYRRTEGFRPLAGDSIFGGVGVAAAALPDGRVLVSGGGSDAAARRDVAVFDGQDLLPLGLLQAPRRGHTVSVVGAGTFSAAIVIGGDGGVGQAPV